MVALAACVLAFAPSVAQARDGVRWPGTRITYFDATRDKTAVRRAVSAWNSTGLRIRFVRVFARARANIVIRNSTNVPDGCGTGLATLGYLGKGRQGYVNILHGAPKDGQGCAWPGQTFVVTHELGHVLGLGHDDGACALMNTSHTDGIAASKCMADDEVQAHLGQWRCRLIEPRDLRRVQRKYGGTIRSVKSNPWCDLVARMAAPSAMTATFDETRNAVAIELTRPVESAIPSYMANYASKPYYEIHRATGADCTSVQASDDSSRVARYAWSVASGAIETWYDRGLAAGAYCWSAWAFDALGRVSTSSATTSFDVVDTPLRSRAKSTAGAVSPSPVEDAETFDLSNDEG